MSTYIKVSVMFERREDGGLRVYSNEVPGLILSGPDPELVFNDVVPALESLFKHNEELDVEFGQAMSLRYALQDRGFLPEGEKEVRDYVAPYKLSA